MIFQAHRWVDILDGDPVLVAAGRRLDVEVRKPDPDFVELVGHQGPPTPHVRRVVGRVARGHDDLLVSVQVV